MLLHDSTDVRHAPLISAWRPLLLLLLFTMGTQPVLSAPDADEPKGLQLMLPDSAQSQVASFTSMHKYALLIGVNQYENAAQGITPLRFAVGDATSVYRALVDPWRGGFPPENVTLLTDETQEKPTGKAIGKALNRIITQAREDDLVLIYFSGHGYEEAGRAYLLPSNADLDALDYSAIERDAFVRQIDRIAARKVVVVLDACHSGGVSRGGKGAGRDAALSAKYYESFIGSKGRAFIGSSGGGELSWEDESAKQGIFTSALVEALSGNADTQPGDGIVSLSELRAYVESHVTDWASRRGKQQHPQVSLESAYGDIPLALNYSYLQAESRELGERRDLASRLRVGLAGASGLPPQDLASAVDLLDRYGKGLTLSDPEHQQVDYIRKLVDGTIDVKTYRSAVAGTPGLATPLEAKAERKHSWLSNKWLMGGMGAAAVGVTIAVTSGRGGSNSGDRTGLPDPPAPPGQ